MKKVVLLLLVFFSIVLIQPFVFAETFNEYRSRWAGDRFLWRLEDADEKYWQDHRQHQELMQELKKINCQLKELINK